MIYYANPSTEPIRDAMSAGLLGCITTPKQGNVYFPDEWDTIADNGCFSDAWRERAWFDWLTQQPRTMRFAAAPDVFDPSGAPCHDATLERWRKFGPLIERHGFTPAFVLQVGATADTIPDAPAVFIGGTTEWKLGPIARRIVEKVRDRGSWVHMGRVNSLRRLRYAAEIGCQSADGTFLTFGPDVNLPRLLRFLAITNSTPSLFAYQETS